MKRQAYQHPELRDANDNIIQEGTYGKESPLVNGDNTGVLDYINNNLEALYDAQTAAGNAITTGGLTVTGDVDITGDLSVSGAITGKVLTYQQPKKNEPSKWEDNTIQAIARAFPEDHPTAYEYGVKVTLGKIKNEEGHTNLYFPHNGGMYLKNYWGSDSNTSGWLTMLTDKNYSQFALPKNGTAVKATADAAGNNIASTYLPAVVGAVVAFAGRTTPQGWLLCDGSAVSRTDYAALFAVIGTTYGAGNGSTTFNLPNLVDKFVEGSATAGTVKSAGLPNITGVVWINGGRSSTNNGAIIYTAQQGGGGTDNPNTGVGSFNFDASRSSSVYGKSSTVQPPALTMRYIIKY